MQRKSCKRFCGVKQWRREENLDIFVKIRISSGPLGLGGRGLGDGLWKIALKKMETVQVKSRQRVSDHGDHLEVFTSSRDLGLIPYRLQSHKTGMFR